MDLSKLSEDFAGLVWGTPLIVLLFGTHLFLTWRTGFIQRFMGRAIKISFSKEKEGDGDVTQFGALMTALAATIGAGNIAGVATAVTTGGPGAVFWMWLTGVFGIATKYGEAVLAVKYRVQNPDGTFAGGPMYVLERGMGQKWLGVVFAVLTAFAAVGIGNMYQANMVVGLLNEHVKPASTEVLKWSAGLVMAALTAASILGGVKSIARWCSVLVPVMAVGYVVGCLLILGKNVTLIPGAISEILTSAFDGTAVAGGLLGGVVKAGIKRGLFSNESGLGSAPIVAAAAQTRNPIRQALVSATGTFWDTVVICLMTGLVLVTSGHYKEGLQGPALMNAAFSELSTVGPIILIFGLATFVFSTILGWSYYGERALEYLFGQKAIKPYRILWVVLVVVGSVQPASVIINFSDAANGLMAIPNLIALIALSGVIAAETRAHKDEFK
ncbi:MAG: alanine:cation symporter family protein [Verrucomicrobiaceae bacterium]|nr:alanine:cation symporter family protein [Verrucomicrobiaceae bacterium]